MLSHRSFLRVPLVASFALLGACKSDGIAREDVPAEYVAAVCDYFADCPNADFESSIIRVIIANSPPGTCEDALGREFQEIDTYDAQIEAGTIRYDSGAAADCLAGIRNGCFGIEGAAGAVPACDEVYVGTVAIGGGCVLDEECAGDAYCDEALPGTCGGVCAASATLGQACGGDNPDCTTGGPDGQLNCQPTAANDTFHCVLHRFVTASAGQACGEVDTDGDDQTHAVCDAGLYCRYANPDDDVGACAEPLADLATCVTGVDVCADGGLCLPSGGGSRCTAVTVQNEPDTACNDLIGPYCNPLLRLECAAGVCQEVGDGTVGAGCRSNFATDCAEGLYCNTDGNSNDGVCAAEIANGLACDPDEAFDGCASGYCDFDGVTELCADAPTCE